jgi:hypothetical protein
MLRVHSSDKCQTGMVINGKGVAYNNGSLLNFTSFLLYIRRKLKLLNVLINSQQLFIRICINIGLIPPL